MSAFRKLVRGRTATKIPRLPSWTGTAAGFRKCAAFLCELYSSALHLLFGLPNALFQSPHGKVRLLLVNQERRREPQRIFARAKHEQSLVKRTIDNRVTQVRSAFFCSLIAHKLNANHQAFAANVADDLELVRPIRGALENVLSHFLRVLHQTAFNQVHRCKRSSEANWIPAKRSSMRTRLQSHTPDRAIIAPNGIPLAIPFALVMMSGSIPACSNAHHLPVRPMPDCTSSVISMIPC